jgi:regulatory protein
MTRTGGRSKPRLSAERLWEFALKTLASRAHSTGELRRKLIQKAQRASDVEEAISRLRDYGYLNDRCFAESYAGSRLENQGLGRSRVLRDLRERKVSAGLAEGAVNRAYQGVDEMELIDNFIRRKFRPKTSLAEELENPARLGAAYRKLIRAGFSSANVIRALKRISKRQDLLDSFEPPEEPEQV